MWILSKMKGKIDIIPDSYNYSPGDTIKGKVKLLIKKSIKSNGLTVRLVGERIQKSYSRGSSNTNTQYIYDFKMPIDGEKQYEPGPEIYYDFEMKIPSNITTKIEGLLGTLVNTAQLLGGASTQIKWFLIAELDIPGVNLSKKVQINISQ